MSATTTPGTSTPPVAGLPGQTPAAPDGLGKAPGAAGAPHVIGLDLSLTATGIAGPGWTHLVASAHDGDAWPRRAGRLRAIRDEVLEFAMNAELVVIEGPAYSAVSQSTWDRAGLWWSVVSVLQSCEVPYAVVNPAGRLIYATGSGQSKNSKGRVFEAVVRRYPTYELAGDDNLADAVVFMAMGCRALGWPLEASLPATHLRAMDKVAWPEVAT